MDIITRILSQVVKDIAKLIPIKISPTAPLNVRLLFDVGCISHEISYPHENGHNYQPSNHPSN